MSCLLQRIASPVLLLVCSCLYPLALFAQPPKATGSVAGRITDGEKPIPGITVTARDSTVNSSGQSDLRGRSVTDGDGRYRIEALPVGRYRIVPQHALYVVNQTATSRSAPGDGLNLAEGESVENTDFKLTKGGVIAGRITDYDGKPASGVLVTLTRAEPSKEAEMIPVARAKTNAEGVYRMTGVSAGRFRLRLATAIGVDEEQLNTEDFQGRALNLSENESVENFDLKLIAGGVITGKVLDADEHPYIGVRVQLFRVQPAGRRQAVKLNPINPQLPATDDRGSYRIFGLPPGTYVLAAGKNSIWAGLWDEAFPLTYHPGTTSESDAALIHVKPASEAKDIDIRVKSERRTGFALTLRVVDAESGKPLAGIPVGYQLAASNGMDNFMPTGLSDADGLVRTHGLLPGRYGASVAPWLTYNAAANYFSEATPFEVISSDVEEIEVKAQRAASVRGKVVIEGVTDVTQRQSLLAKLRTDTVFMAMYGATPLVTSSRYLNLNPDGTFEVAGLIPGRMSFSLNRNNAPSFMLARVESEHVSDVEGLVLAVGQRLTEVRVVLGYGTTKIRGMARIVNGKLPTGASARVRLRRADAPWWVFAETQSEVDGRGEFLFEGIAAGQYELTLFVYDPQPQAEGPAPVTQNLTVAATREVSVTLTLDLKTEGKEKQ